MHKRGTAVTRTALTQPQLGFGRFVSLRRFWQVLAVIVAIISLTAGAMGLTISGGKTHVQQAQTKGISQAQLYAPIAPTVTTDRPASASPQAAALPSIHVQGNKTVTATGEQVILRGVNRRAGDSSIRQAVVSAARSYLGRPYQLVYGWTCSPKAMDCECFNRHAIWDGTYRATGTGLQLWDTLQGQINAGHQVTNPQPGDLVFWDTAPNDGNLYGGNGDHTGIYIGNNTVIDANAYYGYVKYDTVTLNGAYPPHIFIDVLSANGY